MQKMLKKLIIGVLVILLIASTAVYFYLQSFHPTYEGTLTLQGLQEEVEVYFDEYGIPHIYAQSEEDAYFAFGYIHAQERLFQMEMLRRVGSGRLAEILGEDLVETDQFFRTIGLKETAEKSAKAYLSERTAPYQKAMYAYLDGLNAYMENGKLPLEFQVLGIGREAFTTTDIYSIAVYMGYTFSIAFKTDPLLTKIQHKLGEKYTKDFAIGYKGGTAISSYPKEGSGRISEEELINKAIGQIFDQLPVPVWSGSNSWVVSGSKTKSGKVFLANDAHIGYSQPAVWYEAHLEYPNQSFYGNFVAGMPFSTIGHTKHHAWGVTMLENDDTDFYEEKLNPDNPNQVQFKDTWEDLKTRHERIKVKGKEDVEFEVKISRHGPIINDCIQGIDEVSANPIAVSMTLTKFTNPVFQAFYQCAKAKDMEAFENACAMMTAPGFNMMYGDTTGNIAWFATAKLSKRPAHVNSKFILMGYDGVDELLGYHDWAENPKSINPPSGFVYSSNNQPDTAFGILHQGYYLPENRAKRITTLLKEEDQWDMDKMKRMITDGVSPTYAEVAKEITSVLAQNAGELNDTQTQALELLKSWDGQHDLESIAPTIFYKVVYHILARAMQDELGEKDFTAIVNTMMMWRTIPLLLSNDTSLWWDNTTTDDTESRQTIFSEAFERATSALGEQLGNNPQAWEWQKVHQIAHKHAFGLEGGPLGWYFNVGPIPINGGHEVINNVSFDLTADEMHTISFGPSKRILIDLAEIENAVSILPTGQSGHVASKHYDDQAQLYADGKFRNMMMNETEIKEGSRKLVLKAK